MGPRGLLLLGLLIVLVGSGGAGCPQTLNKYTAPGPRVLPQAASLDDVMRVVNDNSARIHSLYSTDATISAPGTPTLRANVAFERPKRLRVRAETALTGPEIDLGSNDQLFWVWAKRPLPAVFFCRHEQYYASAARQILPIQPEWVVEALGVTTFDPAQQHTGPYAVRGGRLEVRTQRVGPEGPQTKVTLIDAQRGWVLEQHLYDARGTRLASAMTSQHWQDPASGVTVPRRIELQVPATQFSMTLNLRSVQVNQLSAATGPLFDMPSYPSTNPIDLADPNLRLLGPTPVASPAIAPPPPQASRPTRFY